MATIRLDAPVLGLILILLAAFAPAAGAATIPSIGDVLRQPDKSASVPRPEPAALQANWWHHFNVKGEELDRRIQETNQRLKALLDELPKPTVTRARPLVGRIATNLSALAQARAQPSMALPPPPVFTASYTIEQLLDLIRRRLDRQAGLPAEDAEVAASEKAIRIANEGVDTQLAAYLNLPATDPERVLRGLEIMADRSAVVVAEEQLRLRRAQLLAHAALANQLVEEQAVAAERLAADAADIDRLERDIQQAQEILQQARERVTKEQTATLSLKADRARQTGLPYQEQRVVSMEVEEAVAQVRLIRLLAQRQLAQLIADAGGVDADALRQQLADWTRQLADIRRSAVDWSNASQQERNRAAEGMASGATLSGGAVPLFGMLFGDRLALAQQTLVTLQRLDESIAQVETFVQIVGEELARREGGLRDWLARAELALRQLGESMLGWTRQSLFKLGDTPVTALGLLRIAFILFIAWLISYWLRRVLTRLGESQQAINQSALYTVGRLSHYGIVLLGFVIGLASIGVDFTNFALVAGAIGIGIGFGLQSIVSNFVSGLILLFERTLKVGDFVELASGVTGEVRAINVRSTLISTNDNVDIVVPNSKFINDNVVNWTLMDAFCRIHVPFKAAYGTDVELVSRAGLEAAERVPHTLKTRKPAVWLVDFGDSCFGFELVVWITAEAVKRPSAVQAAYKREIALALDRHGVEIPVPQRDLRLRAGFERPMPARGEMLAKDGLRAGDGVSR
ncbi:MAG: mechanosensitive ion channel [Pseudomonadota bacterium]|nr:mechanosensitive ion channel [Pseudomonadota bacterium]